MCAGSFRRTKAPDVEALKQWSNFELTSKMICQLVCRVARLNLMCRNNLPAAPGITLVVIGRTASASEFWSGLGGCGERAGDQRFRALGIEADALFPKDRD